MSVKMKVSRESRVNIDSFVDLRKIDFDNQLVNWFKELTETNVKDVNGEFDGVCYSFKGETFNDFCPDIRRILYDINSCFSLKEFINISVSVYTPSSTANRAINIINPAEYGVLDRVIIAGGSNEQLDIKVNVMDTRIPKFLKAGTMIRVKCGFSSAFNISFDNNKTIELEHRKGFRDGRHENKKLQNRCIVVVDFSPGIDTFEEIIEKSVQEYGISKEMISLFKSG